MTIVDKALNREYSYTMTKPSRAARMLEEKLAPDVTRQQLADRLDVSRQTVAHWIAGLSRPTPERMKEIQEMLKIPMEWWTE